MSHNSGKRRWGLRHKRAPRAEDRARIAEHRGWTWSLDHTTLLYHWTDPSGTAQGPGTEFPDHWRALIDVLPSPHKTTEVDYLMRVESRAEDAVVEISEIVRKTGPNFSPKVRV